MGGFRIGIGVGLKYSTPIKREIDIGEPPPPSEIKDAILSEKGKVLLLESGSYLKQESPVEAKNNTNKSY